MALRQSLRTIYCLRTMCCTYRTINTTAATRLKNFFPQQTFHNSCVSLRRFCSSKEVTIDGESTIIASVEVKMNLIYKCQVCNAHNSHIISRQAYEKGVVIVTCEGCENRHLIADNLNWFQDIKEKNVEQMLAKKGEVVLRVKTVPDNNKEYTE